MSIIKRSKVLRSFVGGKWLSYKKFFFVEFLSTVHNFVQLFLCANLLAKKNIARIIELNEFFSAIFHIMVCIVESFIKSLGFIMQLANLVTVFSLIQIEWEMSTDSGFTQGIFQSSSLSCLELKKVNCQRIKRDVHEMILLKGKTLEIFKKRTQANHKMNFEIFSHVFISQLLIDCSQK